MEEQKKQYKESYLPEEKEQIAYAAKEVKGVKCPQCGALNEPDATFCENCGKPIGEAKCPYCGATIVPGGDYCESCHHFVQNNVCTFCGTMMSADDFFCQECGAPREGIVCPVCHTRGKLSFCLNCGTPLTESARQEHAQLLQNREYIRMKELSREFEELQHVLAVQDEYDVARNERADSIRERALALLNETEELPVADKREGAGLNNQELVALIQKKKEALQVLLNQMAMAAQPTPASGRRYALARKPAISKLGWRCNFKNEIHRGPQECACPQMGGTWIVMDGLKEKKLKSDK